MNNIITQDAQLSQQQIKWVPDEKVDSCKNCKSIFTLINRRHHCRRCGYIFCQDCSTKRCSLPEYGIQELTRVCDDCFYFEERRKEYEKFKENFEKNYLPSLKQGQTFVKHGASLERKVYLDIPLRAIVWHKVKASDPKKEKIRLSRIKEVAEGAKLADKDLKKFKVKTDKPSFSLVSENVTVVFYADNEDIRKFWIEGLKQAIHIYGSGADEFVDDNDMDYISDSSEEEEEKKSSKILDRLKSDDKVKKKDSKTSLDSIARKKEETKSTTLSNSDSKATAKSAILDAQLKLNERGEKLTQIDDKASQMADNAKDFLSAAQRLKEKTKK